MNILIVSPEVANTHTGNRTTTQRWTRLLRQLGHTVTYRNAATPVVHLPVDMLLALHARKSSRWIAAYHEHADAIPIVVALTGTDLYRDRTRDQRVDQSIERAAALIVLQPRALEELSASERAKTHVIYQSDQPLDNDDGPFRDSFTVCVIAHLREVKDPLRTAEAVRSMPSTSRIRVVHFGAALDPTWAERAQREVERNDRYEWRGEVSRSRVRQFLARSHLLALTSTLEGGANVVSEAIIQDTPVVSSRIPGSIGLLGADYPGYFSPGATDQLRSLLRRAEQDSSFYSSLQKRCRERADRFTPEAEQQALANLVESLAPGSD